MGRRCCLLEAQVVAGWQDAHFDGVVVADLVAGTGDRRMEAMDGIIETVARASPS